MQDTEEGVSIDQAGLYVAVGLASFLWVLRPLQVRRSEKGLGVSVFSV